VPVKGNFGLNRDTLYLFLCLETELQPETSSLLTEAFPVILQQSL